MANHESESITLEHFLRFFQPNGDQYKILDPSKGEGHPSTFYPSVSKGFINTEKCRKYLL